MKEKPQIRTLLRFPVLAVGILTLVLALWGGLARIGWELPVTSALPLQHGPLMISGFLGILISLERAIALGWGWAFVGPLLTGIGTVSFVAGLPGRVGPLFMTFGSVGLVITSLMVLRLQRNWPVVLVGLGALAWLTGNSLWLLGWPIHSLVALWLGFVVLTVLGERLELSRFTFPPGGRRWGFWAGLGCLILGLILCTLQMEAGFHLIGVGMVIVSLWLLYHDLARQGIRHQGKSRFTSVCLLVGFVWLGISGLLWVLFGGVVTGPRYDAVLHTAFLGFAFSMIFGHAPIVFPVLLRRPMALHQTVYVPFILFHLSLLLRVGCDIGGWWAERHFGESISGGWLQGQEWGGLLNAMSIVFFLLYLVSSLRKPTDPSRTRFLTSV